MGYVPLRDSESLTRGESHAPERGMAGREAPGAQLSLGFYHGLEGLVGLPMAFTSVTSHLVTEPGWSEAQHV